jgi:hypothetical protein
MIYFGQSPQLGKENVVKKRYYFRTAIEVVAVMTAVAVCCVVMYLQLSELWQVDLTGLKEWDEVFLR